MATRHKSFSEAPSVAYLSILFFMVLGLFCPFSGMDLLFIFLVHSMMLLQCTFTRGLGKWTGVKD